MSVNLAIKRAARLAAVVVTLAVFSPAAYSQQPSAAAMATAKELVAITGATALFNPLIAGVVEQAKILFLQQDPALNKDLTEIADKMRTDLAPRFVELTNEVASSTRPVSPKPELKEILAFYKSPVGKKLLVAAADRRQCQHEIRADLGQQTFRRSDHQDAREMRAKGHEL